MKLAVASGKGGTGKTSLTAAFAHLAADHVICDLDVDAPDLHLLFHPENIRTQEFISGHRMPGHQCFVRGRYGRGCHGTHAVGKP